MGVDVKGAQALAERIAQELERRAAVERALSGRREPDERPVVRPLDTTTPDAA